VGDVRRVDPREASPVSVVSFGLGRLSDRRNWR
jgi:hypothetical protein